MIKIDELMEALKKRDEDKNKIPYSGFSQLSVR